MRADLQAREYRTWTRGEELANSLSHGFGFVVALIAVPILWTESVRRGDARSIVSVGVFGLTVLLVYLSSTLYHALPEGRTKRRFEVLDNAAVFLLIAGTYTPLTFGLMRDPWGNALFGIIWLLAAAGVGLTVLGDLRYPVLSALLCLAMGWLCLVALRPISRSLPGQGLLMILIGGVSYTAGLAFWAARGLRYHHLVWHLFVLIGTGCHFLAILWYAT